MFQIKSYLQFQNTPNGKPRVLKEGVDYNLKTVESLHKYLDYDRNDYDVTLFNDEVVASLSDCRPLLTVEIDGGEWTEGDIVLKENQYGIFYYNEEGANFMFDFKGYSLSVFDLDKKYFEKAKQSSFFKNPKDHSRFVLNCTGEEGWEKILKLLNITN